MRAHSTGSVADVVELDSDAVRWSTSPAEAAGRPVLVVMHGLGANEDDLFALAPALPHRLVVAALRAPLPWGQGFAWFPVTEQPAAPDAEAVDAAAAAVLSWIEAELPVDARIALLGFSQGGAMCAQLLRHAPGRFEFAVALSGFVADGPDPGDAELAELRPPAFWGRGDADAVIPFDVFERADEWWRTHTSLTEHVYRGLGHGISGPELADIVAFIDERLAE